MTPRTSSTVLLATALLLGAAPFARADIKLGQERFAGHGTRGPYAISRQAVEDLSEQVWVNGQRMIKGQDYLFDASMGALSFTEPIRFSDSVEVDYQYDTAKAHAPTATVGTFGLLNTAGGGLSLTYGFKPTASGDQTLSSLGFSGQGSLFGSTLTSSFMVDKTAGANAGADAQNMSLAMKRDTGPFTYSLSFANVGKSFSQADALKLVKGSQALNFNGTLQLAQNSALTLKKVDASTPDAKTGVVKDTSLTSGGLGLNLSPNTKLTALHEVQSEAQGTASKSSSVDRLQLDQKLGNNATASVLNETVTTGTNGQDETVKATKMALAASGDHGLQFNSSLSLTDSSKTGSVSDTAIKLAGGDKNASFSLGLTDRKADAGNQQTQSLSLQSGATDRLKLALNLTNNTGVKNGLASSLSMSSVMANGLKFNLTRSDDHTVANGANATNMGMEYTGSKTLKMVASMATVDDGTKTTGKSLVNIEADPSSDLKLVMTHTGDDNGTLNKEANGLNLVATPNAGLKLTAAVGEKVDDKGDGQSKAVGVEANPNGGLSLALSHTDSTDSTGLTGANKVTFAAGGKVNKITGSYVDALSPTGASSIKAATVNLVPVKNFLTVGGSYSDETKQDKTQVQIAMLQADIKPSAALAVSGYYKQRDTGTADQINTVNASVTLKPTNALQMVGTYSSNPEEKDQVIRTVRRGLTLQTQMGGLTFSGGYIQENSLLDASQGTRAEFKLGLQCGKNAKLQGGFAQTIGAVRGYTPQLAYNVNYNHNIGSDFSLLLDANVVQNDVSVPTAQRQDIKATANLGLRF